MGNFRGVGPLSLVGNVAENWKTWKQRFENYLVATETIKKDEATKTAQLLHYIGEDEFVIYDFFTFGENEGN